MMKTVARRFLIVLALVVAALSLGVVVPRPIILAGQATDANLSVLLISSAIHTDIAVPLTEEVRQQFAFLEAQGLPVSDPAARWVIFGWGGRSFYTQTPRWSELKVMPVLRALTVDSSVMHVELAGDIRFPSPSITQLRIDPKKVASLTGFIRSSFIDGPSGLPVALVGAGYGPDDLFFEAHGYFNAALGCNTWTAAALRTAGLRTGLWNPLPASLNLSVRIFDQDAILQ